MQPSADGIANEVLALARPDALAVMLYGSAARGDSSDSSDVDVVQLVPSEPGTTVNGNISIVSYLPSQLREMALEGSLFVWHLCVEGLILRDTDDALKSILDDHPGPDFAITMNRIRTLSAVLDVDRSEYERHEEGLRRVGRFLLRTAVYVRAHQHGVETFSTTRAAQAVDASGRINALLDRLRETSCKSWEDFTDCKARLAYLLGGLNINPYGSLEALVVRTELMNPGVSALALHVVSNAVGELDYADAKMPIL